MCPIFNNPQLLAQDNAISDRFLDLHRKIRSKLCKEIFAHVMAVIVFSGLVIISIFEVLKFRDHDLRKLTAAVLGIGHFGLCTTAILHLKYSGVIELNPLKCKVWIYFEVYNIAAITAFIVLATRHLLPAPFHQWTGTALLLIIYWLPLIMYKTSQICQMLEFASILYYLHDTSIVASTTQTRRCCDKSETSGAPQINVEPSSSNVARTFVPAGSGRSTFHQQQMPSIVPISKSLSSPHIPYEWALIDSISSALP